MRRSSGAARSEMGGGQPLGHPPPLRRGSLDTHPNATPIYGSRACRGAARPPDRGRSGGIDPRPSIAGHRCASTRCWSTQIDLRCGAETELGESAAVAGGGKRGS